MASEEPKTQDDKAETEEKNYIVPDVKSESSLVVEPDPDILLRAKAEVERDKSS